MMVTALQATKLMMMSTTMTMTTGDDNNDGDGAKGDGATGYHDDDLGCAFRPAFRFIPVLIFRNSGFSAEFPDSGGTHIGIKSFQGKTGQD